MENIRKAVVAGSFYPSNREVLRKYIDNYLEKAQLTETYDQALGIVSPHAGYLYSGACAAFGYRVLRQGHFKKAVILAPSHQAGGFFYSVGNYDYYETPLGKIKTDTEILEQLKKDSNFISHPYAHIREHSLEMQLPFLQVIGSEFELIPILVGNQSYESSVYLSDKLTEILDFKETVFIASSDLSHYHDVNKARELDSALIRQIENLNAVRISEGIGKNEMEACGSGPIMTLIDLAKRQDYRSKVIKYAHSGEISGDNSQVVGYLSAVFYK